MNDELPLIAIIAIVLLLPAANTRTTSKPLNSITKQAPTSAPATTPRKR